MRPVRAPHALPALALLAASLSGCGGCDSPSATPDAGAPDASHQVTTDLCDYVPMEATAGAGGDVTAGALSAGAAEAVLHVPVGTALGGYTGRAGFLGDAGEVDLRKNAWSGSFNPSVGVVTRPRAKALALTTDGAGGDTVIIVKVDAIFAYEGLLFDLEERLGPDFAGKVLYATSHSHSAWAQHTGHSALKLGSGELRAVVYDRVLAGMEAAARAALAARVPARLGVFSTDAFDPGNTITRDRRGENNDLMGGPRKDDRMFLIRVDNAAGDPIAAVPIYGVHGTINDQDNPLATTEAAGAAERMLETQLPIDVVVMHLQSAGADTSPTPRGGVDCAVEPGRPSDPCFSWTTEEGHGQAAAAQLLAAWEQAGEGMQDTLALEMVTRSVELGPDPATFTIRDGALAYAPFDLGRLPDGQVFDGNGNLISPIDEFNAPVGAALCETGHPDLPGRGHPRRRGHRAVRLVPAARRRRRHPRAGLPHPVRGDPDRADLPEHPHQPVGAAPG
jgi:neutral ceramidase